MGKKEKKLIGIKAIAGYLDMSVRNVYYWEIKLGLPIHRFSSHTGYRIYAYKEEIDNWMQDKDVKTLKSAKHKKIFLSVIISICILIPVLIFLLSQFPGDGSNGLASFIVDGKIIHVINSKGDILWSINHGDITSERDLKYVLDTWNIDNDPQKEVVACIYDLLHKDKYSITLFDHDGRIIWKRMMIPKYTFSEIEIKNYFRPMPVRFARSKTNEILIFSKWIHMERFLSIIACHNLEGDLVSQYHHTGQLDSSLELIDLDGDGCVEIVFGGTNNLLNGEAIIGVLPLEGFYGINPPYRVETEYNDQAFNLKNYIADEIVQGNQLEYLRFKKTNYLIKYRTMHFISTAIAYFSDNLIHFHLNEWTLVQGKGSDGFNYIFDKKFTLKKVTAPSDLIKVYPEFLGRGDIDIPLKELLKIYSNIVYRWEDGCWVPVNNTISD